MLGLGLIFAVLTFGWVYLLNHSSTTSYREAQAEAVVFLLLLVLTLGCGITGAVLHP